MKRFSKLCMVLTAFVVIFSMLSLSFVQPGATGIAPASDTQTSSGEDLTLDCLTALAADPNSGLTITEEVIYHCPDWDEDSGGTAAGLSVTATSESVAEAFLTVNMTAWSIPAGTGNTTVSVSSNTDWTASANVAWLTLTAADGSGDGQFTLAALANSGATGRTGTVTVTGGGVTRTIEVTQEGADGLILSLETWDISAVAQGTTVSITTGALTTWTVISSDWISVSPTSGMGSRNIQLNAQANSELSPRSGHITVSGGGATRTIEVTQEAYRIQMVPRSGLSVNISSWNPPAAAGSTTVQVSAMSTWTVSRGTANWITLSRTSGSGNQNFTISVSRHTGSIARGGTVTVTGGGTTRNIAVIQQGADNLSLNMSSWNPPASQTTVRIQVTTGILTGWRVAASSWLSAAGGTGGSVSPTTGMGNGTITVTAPANTSTSPRSGSISVTGAGITRTVTITQQGAQQFLSVGTTAWNPMSINSSTSVNVTANTTWTASSNAAWLTTNVTSGTGNRAVTLSAATNTSVSERTGTVTFRGAGQVRTVTVRQHGAIGLERSTWSVPMTAWSGGFMVNASGGFSWTASRSATWITVSPASGSGTGRISISVLANTGPARTGTVTVTGSGQSRTMTISQAGTNTLNINQTSWSPAATGGTLNVAVTSNTDWAVARSGNWMTLSRMTGSGNGNFSVTAAANTSTVSRTETIVVTTGNLSRHITVTQAPAATLTVNRTAWTSPAAASGVSVNVTSNTTWSVTRSATWITLSRTSGSGNLSFNINTTANTGAQRTGTVTVSGGGVTRNITITQQAVAATLSLGMTTWSPSSARSVINVSVNSNTNWTALSANTAWLTLSPTISSGTGNGSIQVTAAANTGAAARTGTISVSAGGLTRTLTVTQAGAATLTTNISSWNPAATAGSTNVNVTSNTSWTVTRNVTWLTLSRTSGSGNQSFTISATANTANSGRVGSVTVTGGGITRTIAVIQAGNATLTVTPASILAPATVSSFNVNITSNTNWVITRNVTWLAVSRTSGSNNASFTITTQAHTGTANRTGTVSVTGGNGVERVITVTQQPAVTLTTNISGWNPSSNASSTNVNVTSGINWNVSRNVTWLTLSRTTGSGNQSFTITAAANTGAARTGTVTVTGGGIARNITVTQAGAATLNLSTSSWSPGSGATSTTINVTANSVWSVSRTGTWLTLNRTSGTGNGNFTVTAAANTGTAARTATITVSSNPTRTITVTQAGAAATTHRVTFSSNGIGIDVFGPGSITVNVNSGTSWANFRSTASFPNWSAHGRRIVGWYTTRTATAGTNVNNLTGNITRDTTLYARWETVTNRSVTFWINGGTNWGGYLPITSPVVMNTADGTSWANFRSWNLMPGAPTPPAGMTFVGWFNTSAASGGTNIQNMTGNITSNQTFWARYAPAGNTLTLNRTSWAAPAAGGSVSTNITSNTSWTIARGTATWITLSRTTGTGNQSFTMTAAANPNTTQRSGTVTVTGGGITRSITITQAGAATTLTLNRTSWDPPAEATSVWVNVTSNVAWTASSNAAWLNVASASGSGNGSFAINPQPNPNATRRSGVVTVTGGGVSRTITVNQAGFVANLTLNRDSWALSNVAQALTVTVTSNVTWTVSRNGTWLSFTPSSGTGNRSFTVNATANTGTASRTGSITVTGGGITRTIAVTQAGTATTLTVDRTSWNPAPAAGGAINVNVRSNLPVSVGWRVSSNASWLWATPSSGWADGHVTISAQANTGTTQRNGTVTITGGGVTRNISVVQMGTNATLTINDLPWSPSNAASSRTISVTSNVAWSVSSAQNWISVSPASGSGNGSFVINTTANTGAQRRDGVVTVTGGGMIRTIAVMQAGTTSTLTTNITGWGPTGLASSINVNVTSNTNWTVTRNVTWITLSRTSGTGNQSFTMSVPAHTGTARTGTVTVSGGGITRTINVTQQAGANLAINTSTWNAPATAGGTTINVTSNSNWTVSRNVTWLSTSRTSGSGNMSFNINAEANTNSISRTGTVSITAGNITRTVTVTQAQGALQISTNFWNAPAGASSTNINVTSVTNWTVSRNVTWLTLSRTSGSGNLSFTINAQANTGTVSRSGTVSVSGGGFTRNISVTQAAGANLTVSPASWSAPVAASSVNVNVTSNAAWTVGRNVTWLTTSRTSGSGNMSFTINTQTNTGTVSRSGTVTVTGGGITRNITVTQAAQALTLTTNITSWSPASGASGTNVNVTSNTNWNVSRNVTWLTTSRTSGSGNMSFTINAQANTGTTARSGTVTVSGGGITRNIFVTQAGAATLNVSTTFWSAPSNASSTNVNVTSNAAWTVSRNVTWLTTSRTSGSGNLSFTINAQANTGTTARSGTVTVTGGGVTRNISVTQAGAATLNVSTTFWSAPSNASSTNVNVTSNAAWTVSRNVTWLTLSRTSGSGNMSFTINAQANTGTTARSGTVTVSGGGVTRNISVTQAAQALTLNTNIMGWQSPANASSTNVNVTSNTNWNVSRNVAWINVSRTSGSGNMSFTISTQTNTATTSRTGTVTVSGGGQTRTISVTQQAANNLTTNVVGWSTTSNAGSLSVNVTANVSWSVSRNVTWITLSRTSGVGNASFTISVAANPGTAQRSGSVTVSGGGVTRTISVTQRGR